MYPIVFQALMPMSDLQIKTDTDSLAQRRAARRQNKSIQYVIAGAIAACLVFVGLIVSTAMRSGDPPATDESEPASIADAKSEPDLLVEDTTPGAEIEPKLIADDGETMWASPTAGRAINLAGLPTGCGMFVSLRPAEMLANSEGNKMLAALGPRGAAGVEFVERSTGLRLADIERLIIGLRSGKNFAIETTMVVTPRAGVQSKVRNLYRPRENEPDFVVASPELINEVRELAGAAPPLRREVEAVLAATDSNRHITLLVTPTFLFDDGRSMWRGSMAGLREPLFEMLPDSTRCAAVSLHLGDNFFAELRLAATIDQRPLTFANRFADKVAAWPSSAERTIASLPASAYSAAVVARLPAMLRALSRYQRVGVDDDQALLRAYLPAPAGHNLLMAGELLLAERMAGGGQSNTMAPAPESQPASIEERLKLSASVSFTRDTLETAVNLLAEEIGVEIVLLGGDLQLDGITKNQSFGLDERDKPAGDILVTILRLANPDKTATGPADLKQKLVYVVGDSLGGPGEAILVTTRAQAEKRGDELPAVFVE